MPSRSIADSGIALGFDDCVLGVRLDFSRLGAFHVRSFVMTRNGFRAYRVD